MLHTYLPPSSFHHQMSRGRTWELWTTEHMQARLLQAETKRKKNCIQPLSTSQSDQWLAMIVIVSSDWALKVKTRSAEIQVWILSSSISSWAHLLVSKNCFNFSRGNQICTCDSTVLRIWHTVDLYATLQAWSKLEGLEGRLSSWSEATKTIGTRFNEYLIRK